MSALSRPVNVVGVDLSLTATGIAWPDGTTSVTTTSAKKSMPFRLRYIRHTFVEHYREVCGFPTIVMLEDLPFTRNNAAGQLGMVHGVIRVAIDDLINQGHCAAVTLVVPGSLKRYACGNGNANKQQMLAEAIRRLGYQGYDDNQADAMWLRQMGLAHYAPDDAVKVPAKHLEALRGVDWCDLTEVTAA